jgi:predicted metal-dependent TIM-barrel fold hydrolase
MALTEETINDKIETLSKGTYKVVGVRTATIIKRDGVEISKTFHRKIILPNSDTSGEDADVLAICDTVFTQAVKDAHAAHLAANSGDD